jgi:ATP-dependent Clp protease ATP-binding subunit ClpA
MLIGQYNLTEPAAKLFDGGLLDPALAGETLFQNLLMGAALVGEAVGAAVIFVQGHRLHKKRLEFSANKKSFDKSMSELSAEDKEVLRLALREAMSFGHEQINSNDLLLALIKSDTRAGEVLRECGIDYHQVRDYILHNPHKIILPGLS